jgi:hypothetical protein
MYNLYKIDLDANLPRLQLIMSYAFADVDYQVNRSFHVRASSKKEKINLNKKLMMFIVHGSKLYYWVDGKDKI